MLSKICPKTCQRYIALPLLGSILDEFTTWSHRRGYALGTIKSQLRASIEIDHFLQDQGAQSLDDLTHHSFETAWRQCHKGIGGTIHQIEQFIDETRSLPSSPPCPSCHTIPSPDFLLDHTL